MITAGIDVGAGSAKAVILEGHEVLAQASVRTGPNLGAAASECYRAALSSSGLRSEDVGYVAATGFGRYQVLGRDIQITEVTCHARGSMLLFPRTRCVLDIGAQSSRAIRVDGDGRVLRFKMNDRCAAGAGRFVERIARALEVSVAEFSAASLRAQDPVSISSICAVLAESEVINHITQGRTVEDIAMGAHLSIADRVLALLRQVGVEDEVTLTGGMSQNAGMVRALEQRLGRRINVSDASPFAGALGAAVLGARRLEKLGRGGPPRVTSELLPEALAAVRGAA